MKYLNNYPFYIRMGSLMLYVAPLPFMIIFMYPVAHLQRSISKSMRYIIHNLSIGINEWKVGSIVTSYTNTFQMQVVPIIGDI